jgi:tripartite-type tricarboxylate transporter receptor subunit TctC
VKAAKLPGETTFYALRHTHISLALLAGVNMEVFKARSGVSILHVPYRGCAPAVSDAAGGQVDLVVSSAPSILPYASTGRLLAVAVTNARRATSAPSIPTVAESGIPELKSFVIGNWYGFMAPLGTPPELIAKFDAETRGTLQTPEVQKKLSAAGIEVRLGTAKDLAAALDADIRQFRQVVESAQIKPE